MKLRIKSIGRISDAELDVRPLTMFVGKNDSGKTYAASAIWALLNYVQGRTDQAYGSFSQKLDAFLDKFDSNGDSVHNFEVTPAELDRIRTSIFKDFQENAKEILKNAIGYEGFDSSKVEVISSPHRHGLSAHIKIVGDLQNSQEDQEGGDSDSPVDIQRRYKISTTINVGEETYETHTLPFADHFLVTRFLPRRIRLDVIGYACFAENWKVFRNVVYLPAARTGVILALDYFVESALRRAALPDADIIGEGLNMPAPIRAFARDFNNAASYFSRIRGGDIRIENHPLRSIVNGRFARARARSKLSYTPDGLKIPIPLASTSSLVTELVSFCLLSSRHSKNTFFIFEEPEAHLHLEAQRLMARALAKMINQGAYILITTHSDTFLQQINNLISLSDHPDRVNLLETLNISSEEVIGRDMVSAYDFECKQGKTKPRRLELTKRGFIAESLNEILIKLTEETMMINDGLCDE